MSKILLSSLGMAVLCCASCDDGEVSVAIVEFRADEPSLAPGEQTTLTWRIDPRAHINLFTWVTLFDGVVDAQTGDDGETKRGIAIRVGAGEGTFDCFYDKNRVLTCANDEPSPRSGSVALPAGPQVFTLRACTAGIDGSAEARTHSACDYQALTLTLL